MAKKSMTSGQEGITINQNIGIQFSDDGMVDGDVLILGNFNGICGEVTKMSNGALELGNSVGKSNAITMNERQLLTTLVKGRRIDVVGDSHTLEYFKGVFYYMMDMYFCEDSLAQRKKILNHQCFLHECDFNSLLQDVKEGKMTKDDMSSKIMCIIKDMKFDMIVTNPPYSKSLHLDILEGLLDNHLNPKGQLVVIEPSTWLINVRKNGKAKKYDAIKKKIAGHVKAIKIENLNKEFNTTMFVPFSITTIDFSKKYDTIKFECCGEVKKVKTLNDCNLIGSYDTIWSILNKVLAHSDMMGNHTTTVEKDGMWYLPYREILTWHGWDSEIDYVPTKNGIYYGIYTTPCCHKDRNDVRNFIGKTLEKKTKDGGKYGGNPEPSVYGTKQELENWKHFIFNNKLPLFINIVLTIDQHNNSKEFLPWLVDRQYTDEEIYAKFNLTEDEIALIDATLKKFERNSPWFKRYMCGEERTNDVAIDESWWNDEKKVEDAKKQESEESLWM